MGDYVTVEEIAEKLSMTSPAIRSIIRRGELPAYKFGKEWRIHKDDLENFIQAAKIWSKSDK